MKQTDNFTIDNLDKINTQPRNGWIIPFSIRGLSIGSSNYGKTNVMISLLINPYFIRFIVIDKDRELKDGRFQICINSQ